MKRENQKTAGEKESIKKKIRNRKKAKKEERKTLLKKEK